jgi:hypothetical protein
MFRDALASTGEAAPQLLDIAQLVARSLPDPSQLAAELPIDSAGPRLQRPQGSRCSYSGSITITSLTPDILQTIQKAADDRALTLDIGNNYIELEFEGRDSNQFVVDFLRILAKAVGTASGEFRCEITADRQDPLYEFFTIRDSKLFRQRGLIIRESEEDITDKTSLTRQSETS